MVPTPGIRRHTWAMPLAVTITITTAERAGSPGDRYISRMLKYAAVRYGMHAIFVSQTVNGRRYQSGDGALLDGEAYLCFPVTLAEGAVYGTLCSNKPDSIARQAEFLGALSDIATAIAKNAEHGIAMALV